MKKTILLFLCVALMIGYISIPISASSVEVMPRYNNIIQTESSFTVDASGEGEVYASYTGYTGVTESVTIKIKIQKKTLGLIWSKVDIGTENNEINITSTNVKDSFIYAVQLNSTGNYRAVITYTVSGSGGADDTIEDICTAEYN